MGSISSGADDQQSRAEPPQKNRRKRSPKKFQRAPAVRSGPPKLNDGQKRAVRQITCSEPWAHDVIFHAAAYPPPASERCSMKPCEGRSCGGARKKGRKLYPVQARQRFHRGRWLCDDCWNEVLLRRQQRFARQHDTPPEAEASPSAEAIQALEAGNAELIECELPPESAPALRAEIDRYLNGCKTATLNIDFKSHPAS